ncbi:hypothetical protein B0H14DRAFT_763841 [Mycena olivaceomarginata]|nr:hypothetical protein B0H14DRAFT_763841 [Mycena olivaceomarginata]
MASTISVLDLPPEITSVIFLYCVLDECGPERRFPTLSEELAPLLLGRICRQWRSIAWSTPELWTMVEVDCPPCIDDVVPHLERWFLRAGSLPLTLDIYYNALSHTSSDALLRLLQRHSARFQDLTLNITPPDDLFRDEMVGGTSRSEEIWPNRSNDPVRWGASGLGRYDHSLQGRSGAQRCVFYELVPLENRSSLGTAHHLPSREHNRGRMPAGFIPRTRARYLSFRRVPRCLRPCRRTAPPTTSNP